MKTNIAYILLLFAIAPTFSYAQLNLQFAKQLSSETLAAAEEKQKCIAVAIVDEGSNLLYFERSSCAPLGSIETSIQKAKSAALFRKATSEFAIAIKKGQLGILSANGVVAIEGGFPILFEGRFLGAIGVGGASSLEDETFAKIAIKKLNRQLKEKK